MAKLISIIGNQWTLFALSFLCFSICPYVLTGMFLVWGLGFLIASVYMAVDAHEKKFNDKY